MYPRAPFVRLILPFIAGIVLSGFIQLTWQWAFVLALLSLVLVFFYHIARAKNEKFIHRQHYGILMNLALVSVGFFVSSVNDQYVPQSNIGKYLDTSNIIEFTLEEKPVEKARSFRSFVSVEHLIEDSISRFCTGGAVVYFQKCKALEKLEAGQKLIALAELKSPSKPLNPGEFDYAAYLQRKGISVQIYLDSTSWQLMDVGIHGRFSNRFVRWRDRMLEVLRPYVENGDVYDVLSALILGKTSELDRELMSHYSGAGAIHVLAVSGLHVGLIYLFLIQLFNFIIKDRFKWTRVIITGFILWLYAAISGFSPSVLRSTVMFTAILIGSGLNRNSDIFNSLSSSAFILLGYDPGMLYDIGFQLSYLAVLGIVLFQKGFESWWYVRSGIMYKIWQLTCVSLAAQVITYPIGLFYFGQFPNYFLLANLIVIPLSTGILYLAIVFFTVAWIPWLAKPVGYLLSLGTNWLNAIVTFTDQLPGSRTENVSISLGWTIFLMLISFWFIWVWQQKQFKQFKYLIPVMSLALLVSVVLQIHRSFEHSTLCFHSLKEGVGMTLVEGDCVLYFHEGDTLAQKSLVDRKLKPFWRSLNRGEVSFVNMDDTCSINSLHYSRHSNTILLRDCIINFEPRQILENQGKSEIVIMDQDRFLKDTAWLYTAISHCDYFLIAADVKEYKWNKIQMQLRDQDLRKVFYLGNGAVTFKEGKIAQCGIKKGLSL
jgi:competence protein ComEC